MTRSRLLAIAVAASAALLVVILWPRKPESPEDLIRQKVLLMIRAAEKSDLSFVMEQVSDSFRGKQGWGKQEVKQILASQLFRRSWKRIFPAGHDVRLVSGDEAEFTGKFIFAGSDTEKVEDLAKETIIQSFEITGTLRLEADGEWRFVTATHRQIDPRDLL